MSHKPTKYHQTPAAKPPGRGKVQCLMSEREPRDGVCVRSKGLREDERERVFGCG
ncbi:hypothetical protein COLO4_10250 [Corchorus olitorius]|uniref:Uncharacterized protein n=1 Tax=Corchorus olitorius TaxID=93759 RepID=A0A1R3K9I0_9ROSI|nr:hypothetical protein COLO4_10250 [Corchorus olitorius]